MQRSSRRARSRTRDCRSNAPEIASARPGLAEQCPSDPRSLVLPLVQEKVSALAKPDMGAGVGLEAAGGCLECPQPYSTQWYAGFSVDVVLKISVRGPNISPILVQY